MKEELGGEQKVGKVIFSSENEKKDELTSGGSPAVFEGCACG